MKLDSIIDETLGFLLALEKNLTRTKFMGNFRKLIENEKRKMEAKKIETNMITRALAKKGEIKGPRPDLNWLNKANLDKMYMERPDGVRRC